MDKIRSCEYRGCLVAGPSRRNGEYISYSVVRGSYRYDVTLGLFRMGPLEIMHSIRKTVRRALEENPDFL
jgi:hypothetical protein